MRLQHLRDRGRCRSGGGEQRRRPMCVHTDVDSGPPRSATMALMLGALTIQGLAPGGHDAAAGSV